MVKYPAVQNLEKSLFVMVCDPSADRHTAKLIKGFSNIARRKVWGVGGADMIANGVECSHNCQDFAVLGVAEVLKQVPFFAKLRAEVLDAIDNRKPSAVLLVDNGGFNLNLAGCIRKRHPDLPILYFISPQVWGSRPWRMNAVRKTITKMLVIFPFEEHVYSARGIAARFVGNPQMNDLPGLDEVMTRDQLVQAAGLQPDKHIIGVFAGSRNREIDNLLPLAVSAMRKILSKRSDVQFVISQANEMLAKRIASVMDKEKLSADMKKSIYFIDETRKYDLMANADILWAKFGTTALESTLFGAPMLIWYRGMWLSFLLFLMFKRVKRVFCTNILCLRFGCA